tara:strand:+ start:2032 stop:2721 length:690 start_codon:yes stop_codon:yes gene_type:complete
MIPRTTTDHNKIQGKISKRNGIVIGFENQDSLHKKYITDCGRNFFFDEKTKEPLDGNHIIVPSLFTEDDYEEYVFDIEQYGGPENDPENKFYIDSDGEFVEPIYDTGPPIRERIPYEYWKKENIDYLDKYPHEVTFKNGYKHGLECYYGYQMELGQGPLCDRDELNEYSPVRDIPNKDEITWKDGRIHGLFWKYDCDGKLRIEEIYVKGVIKQIRYYDDGLGWRRAYSR